MNHLDIMAKSFYNIDAERSVIGCMLISKKALKHVPELGADDFTDPFVKTAFCAIERLVIKKACVDLVTVDQELVAMGNPNCAADLIELTQIVVGAANVAAYVQIVKNVSVRRTVRRIAQQAMDAISDPLNDTESVVGQCRNALRDIRATGHEWMTVSELLIETYANLDRITRGDIKPIGSGIQPLDGLIGGFFPGEMTVIGARPGVGKSAFGLDVGVSAATAGHNVCVVSLEMYPQQFGQRLFSKGARVNGMRLRTGNIDELAWLRLSETIEVYGALPMSFLFSARTLEDIVTEAHNKADEGKLDMLIVDYLQLVRTRQKFESERLRVGHVSAELKQLSKDLNIPVIALAQLSRPEKGRNYVPRMSDLRESGNIEQDADGIVLMHRSESPDDPGVFPPDTPYFDVLTQGGKHYVSFIVDKQRQGEIGRLATIFDPAVMEYRTIAR